MFVTDAEIQEYYQDHQEEVDRFHLVYGNFLVVDNPNYLHADSTLSAFFLRELESIEARTYDTKYKKLNIYGGWSG